MRPSFVTSAWAETENSKGMTAYAIILSAIQLAPLLLVPALM